MEQWASSACTTTTGDLLQRKIFEVADTFHVGILKTKKAKSKLDKRFTSPVMRTTVASTFVV